MDCIFCKLVTENPQNKVLENDKFYALFDLNPVSKGHVIVIPRQHVKSYFDLSGEDAAKLHNLIKDIKNLLNEKLNPDGFNIGINDGEAAGATLDHLLVHLIPRYNGDVPNPQGGVRNIIGIPMQAPGQMPQQEQSPQQPVQQPEPPVQSSPPVQSFPEPKEEVKKEPEPQKEEKKTEQKTWMDLLEDHKEKKKRNDRVKITDL